MSRRRRQLADGIPAAAWFAGQSFHGGSPDRWSPAPSSTPAPEPEPEEACTVCGVMWCEPAAHCSWCGELDCERCRCPDCGERPEHCHCGQEAHEREHRRPR